MTQGFNREQVIKNNNKLHISLLPGDVFIYYLLIIYLGSIMTWAFNLDIADGLTKYALHISPLFIIFIFAITFISYKCGRKIKILPISLLSNFFYPFRSAKFYYICIIYSISVYIAAFFLIYRLLSLLENFGSEHLRANPHLLGIGPIIFVFTILLPSACLFICRALNVFPYANKGYLIGLANLVYGIAPTIILDMRGPMVVFFYAVVCIFYGYKIPLSRILRNWKIMAVGLVPICIFITIAFRRAVFEDSDSDPIINQVFRRTLGRIDVISTTTIIKNNLPDFFFGNGISLFSYIKECITISIPRIVWPDKPVPLSLQMNEDAFIDLWLDRGYELENAGGVSATISGDAFWSNGLLGVILVSFFAGLVAKALDDAFREGGYSLKNASPFLPLAAASFVLAAESFSISMNSLAFNLVLQFILMIPVLIVGILTCRPLKSNQPIT